MPWVIDSGKSKQGLTLRDRWSAALAERSHRSVRLLIVPAHDVFDGVVATVLRLRSAEIHVGESATLSAEDQATLRPLVKRARKSGSKIQVALKAGDGSQMPVQISIRPLGKNVSNRATIGMVVTDMTEMRRNEEMLRALSHRLVQAQEAERGRVALELHDHITQLLCAILVRSQALADQLSARDGPSKREAINLREMLGETAEEVERISRDLRPSVLDELESRYPMLVGTLRDHQTKVRRPFVRFFACGDDWSHEPTDTPLPGAIATGAEPLLLVGAIAGG